MPERGRTGSGSPYEASIGFSRAVRVGDRVLVSGTAPIWPDGSCAADAGAQARRCFQIIAAALEELDAELTDVVRTRMFLTDARHADVVSEVRGEVEMALGETFFSPAYGICRDRFGTPWMVSADGPH